MTLPDGPVTDVPGSVRALFAYAINLVFLAPWQRCKRVARFKRTKPLLPHAGEGGRHGRMRATGPGLHARTTCEGIGIRANLEGEPPGEPDKRAARVQKGFSRTRVKVASIFG